MEKKVINIQNGNMVIEEIKEKQKSHYYIKGYNNKGVSNFNLSQILKYDDVIYYDIETVKLGVDYKLLDKRETLDLSKNILYSFSLLIPNVKKYKKGIEKIKSYFGEGTSFSEKDKYVSYVKNKDEFIEVFYANDNDVEGNLTKLIEAFNMLATTSHSKKNGSKTVGNLKIIGFNNNRFDDLIFKHYQYSNLFTDEVNKCNKIELTLLDTLLKITSYDLRDLSKHFGGNNLAQVGEEIGYKKLDIADDENKLFKDIVKQNLKYNIRDNEIVFEFLKFINEELGIFQTNMAGWSRKYFYKKMFEKLEVQAIQVSKEVNRFRLFGGRTEAYLNLVTNKTNVIKYIDFNSLYTSSRYVLDMATGIKREVEKDGKKTLIYDFQMNKVRVTQKFDYMISYIEEYLLETFKFSYADLAEKYNEIEDKYYMGKFKILGINPLFEKYAEYLEFYFPLVTRINEKSSFSYSNNIYEIGFNECMFLALFDYEVIELYAINKGEDILKDELKDIYDNRTELKKQGSKLEKLEKLKLNAGFGIFSTNNIESQIILDNKQIETLDRLSAEIPNREKKEIWEIYESNDCIFKNGNDYFNIKNIGDYYYSVNEKSGQKWTGSSIGVYGLNITSNSRFMMYCIYLDYILNMTDETTTLEDIKIFYTDTDSLFCDEVIYNRCVENGLIGDELGQLKDELPNAEILRLECFAPKTYEYEYKLLEDTKENKKGDIIVKRVFKGTGEDIERTVYVQSIKQDFNPINRIALNPHNVNKRLLKDNLFINQFGISEELIENWNNFVKRNTKKNDVHFGK